MSFANGMNFYKLFWVFFLCCIIGVILETLWCLIRNHRFESRKGLVYGPFNLVYGLGGLWMTVILYPLRECHYLVIFLVGSIIGGIWEYVCSLFQEHVFGSISWDYKDYSFNLHGRTNLLYCFFWGLLALWWIYDAYSSMSALVEMIPNSVGIWLTWLLFAFMIFDSAISFLAVLRMNQRRSGIPAKNSFWKCIDKWFPDEKVIKIYPNMMFKEKEENSEAVTKT